MTQLLADEAFAGAAFEEELAGFGVFRKDVSLIVDELEGTAVVCGGGVPGVVVGDAFSQIGRVAGVEVAIFGASEDVDVVHVLVSDAGRGGCLPLRELLAPAIRTAGPVKSALRARPRASRKGRLLRNLPTCLRPRAKPRDKKGRADSALPFLFYGVTPARFELALPA